jgi:hypothetical protein
MRNKYKRLLLVLLVGIVVVLPLTTVLASDVFKTTTEMIMWDQNNAYNGYTVFSPWNNYTYMIDMEGNLINQWEAPYQVFYAYLVEDGNLHRGMVPPTAPAGILRGGGAQGHIQEVDWNGNVVWDFVSHDGDPDPANPGGPYINATFRQHHAFQRIWNQELGEYTYLILAWWAKNQADAELLGADSQYQSGYANGWSPCALMEFTYNKELIWQWCFADHMITTNPSGQTVATTEWTDASGRTNAPPIVVATEAEFANYPGRLQVNGVHYTAPGGPRTDYQHCNSFDYSPYTGHIAINAKATSEFYVIDHDGTFVPGDFDASAQNARGTAGDFLYRWGNPSVYRQGKAPGYYDEGEQQMYGTHDIQYIWPYHWRPPRVATDNWSAPTADVALPGAGNFLMFDNGCYNPMNAGSKLIEVNPYLMDAAGTLSAGLVNPPDAGYTRGDSNQIAWVFAENINDFYSSYISSAQRLPNGNTISCSGAYGHFIEVTEDKKLVWEYINPVISNTIKTYISQGDRQGVFRCFRYGPDHPALGGKSLRPGSTITGRIPGTVDQYPAAVTYTGWGTFGGSIGGEGSGGAGGGEGGGGGGY